MDLFTRVHTHPCSIAHTDLAYRPPPSMRTRTLPVSGGPEHTVGASLPSPTSPAPEPPDLALSLSRRLGHTCGFS